jgi:hypothetical protein
VFLFEVNRQTTVVWNAAPVPSLEGMGAFFIVKKAKIQ